MRWAACQTQSPVSAICASDLSRFVDSLAERERIHKPSVTQDARSALTEVAKIQLYGSLVPEV